MAWEKTKGEVERLFKTHWHLHRRQREGKKAPMIDLPIVAIVKYRKSAA